MQIAASMCIYTNDQILMFTLDGHDDQAKSNEAAAEVNGVLGRSS
jgi:hypothetical protein